MAGPNLSPFFSWPLDDVYDAARNPNGYFASDPTRSGQLGTIGTAIGDGWMHVDMDNSAKTASAYLNLYQRPFEQLKPSTAYTLLIEFRNVTGGLADNQLYIYSQADTATRISQTVNTAGYDDFPIKDGAWRKAVVTKPSWEDADRFCSQCIIIAAGKAATFDIRMSLYETEGVEILKDADAPTLAKVEGPHDRYVSDGGSAAIVATYDEMQNAPAGHGLTLAYDGRYTNDRYRSLAFYSGGNGALTFYEAGKQYQATWWARCTSGAAYTGARYVDNSDKGSLGTLKSQPSSWTALRVTEEWRMYTATFRPTQDGTWSRAYFDGRFAASTAGTIEMCGFSLVEMDAEYRPYGMEGRNLGPFYAHDFDDVRSASNPTGYWQVSPRTRATQLSDGWAHVTMDNSSGTGTMYSYVRPAPDSMPVVSGTLLVEVRNLDADVTMQSGHRLWYNPNQVTSASASAQVASTDPSTQWLAEDGEMRFPMVPTGKESPIRWGDMWFGINKGHRAEFDARISFYAGEWDGPYLPFPEYAFRFVPELVRLVVTDHRDNVLGEVDPRLLLEARISETINGEHSLTFTTLERFEKGMRVLTKDARGTIREHVIEGVEATHAGGDVAWSYYCTWSLQHDLSLTMVNSMPGVYPASPVRANEAMYAALAGTSRWAASRVEPTGTGGTSMYYMSGWEAIGKVVEVWGGEVESKIVVDWDTYEVVSREVQLLNAVGYSEVARRFDYGSDMSGITRTVADAPLPCRIVPRGKGQETEAGGYGRRITIAEVNDGIEWIEDPEAALELRVPGGAGTWEYPTLIVINSEIEEPQKLLDWAREHLHDYTRPRVTYKADVIHTTDEGDLFRGVSLGDRVQVVDPDFSGSAVRAEARVVKIDANLIDTTDVKIEVGSFAPGLDSQFTRLSNQVATVSAYVESMSLNQASTEWVDTLIGRINAEANATGGYTYIVPGMGVRTYDREVSDPEVGAEATKVVEIRGGTIRIADSRDPLGNWEWRTVFVSGHIAADMVTAANINAGYIGNPNGNYWNLDTGDLRIAAGTQVGDSTIATQSDLAGKVTSVDVEYAQSQSPTTAPTSGWSTTAPAYRAGWYIWTRTKTVTGNGTTYSDPAMVSGKDGASSVTYSLSASVDAIVRDEAGAISPSSVTFSATQATGTGAPTAYAGRFKVETSNDGSTWTSRYTSSSDQSSYAYAPTAAIAKAMRYVRCTLYAAGGTTTVLDRQTVAVVDDGATGGTGPAGADAYTLVLTNESHTFAATKDGKAIAATTACGIIALKGATRVAATIGTVTGIPSGMTVTKTNDGTTTAGLTIAVTASMATRQGTLSIPVTVDGKALSATFSYALAVAGQTGEQGATGVGVDAIEEQYYLSTSESSQSGGSWGGTQPTWQEGRYIWTRSKVTWTDGSVTYTDPVLAKAINGANESTAALSLTPFFMQSRERYANYKTNAVNADWTDNGAYWLISSQTVGWGGTASFPIAVEDLGAGWVHVTARNTTASPQRFDFFVTDHACVEPGGEYTWLFEARNNNSTGMGTSTGNNFYIVQTNDNFSKNCMFWGANVKEVIEGKNAAAAISLNKDFPPGTAGTYVQRFVKVAEAAGSTHWASNASPRTLARLVFIATAGATLDFELRVSLYEGRYTGPFKPYVTPAAAVTDEALARRRIIRAMSDGVLVGYSGSSVAALVNAAGSFDIVTVTWSGDEPTVTKTLSTFDSDEISLLEDILNIKVDSESGIPLINSSRGFIWVGTETETYPAYVAGMQAIRGSANADGTARLYAMRDDSSGYWGGDVVAKASPSHGSTVYTTISDGYGEGEEPTPTIYNYSIAPVTLYANDSGTTGAITLSESADNLERMVIYYAYANGANGISSSVEVWDPDGRQVDLMLAFKATSSVTQLAHKTFSISGTRLAPNGYGVTNFDVGSGKTYYSDLTNNNIYVYRVIGYRKTGY